MATNKMVKVSGLNARIEFIDGTILTDSNGPMTIKKFLAQILAASRTPDDAVVAYKLALRVYDEEDEALFNDNEMSLFRRCLKAADALSNHTRAVITMALDASEEVEVEEKK